MLWNFAAASERADGKVRGQLILRVEAETREDAESLVRESLPGFDWTQWTSTWGVTEASS